jgi:glycosyltransferase involved in cell wall biosynthesis
MHSSTHISIVIPVYQEEKNINPLYVRLEKVLRDISGIRWEYVFVNDGSRDESYKTLAALAARDPKVKVIDLTRNFGKEIALSAGLHAAGADAVICMDADMQHPPELIPAMIDAWRKGADVVTAVRSGIDRQPVLRRLGSFLFYRLMSRFSGVDLAPGTTDFRLLDKKVWHVFRQMTERVRMFRGLVDWMGFNTQYVYFRAAARQEGKTSFSYARLWQLAINSITSFSLLPLRLTGYLGVTITLLSGVLLARMTYVRLFDPALLITPLAFVVVINTFLMGIILMSIGLVALYIGTIHTEVVNRPLFVVRHRLNFSTSSHPVELWSGSLSKQVP